MCQNPGYVYYRLDSLASHECESDLSSRPRYVRTRYPMLETPTEVINLRKEKDELHTQYNENISKMKTLEKDI